MTIVGGARAGQDRGAAPARRRAGRLRRPDRCSVVLAGVRPEEITEWQRSGTAPRPRRSASPPPRTPSNGASSRSIDQARRLAARGADAVVLIDSLDGCSPHAARKALARARNIVDGGSLTVIATATAPLGGETTVIALDAALTGDRPLPGARPARQRHAAARAAGRRGRRRGDRQDARRGDERRGRRRGLTLGGSPSSVGGAAAAVPRHRLVARLLPALPQQLVDLGGGDVAPVRPARRRSARPRAARRRGSRPPRASRARSAARASIRATRSGRSASTPSRRSTWGTRLSANIVSRSRSAKRGDARAVQVGGGDLGALEERHARAPS